MDGQTQAIDLIEPIGSVPARSLHEKPLSFCNLPSQIHSSDRHDISNVEFRSRPDNATVSKGLHMRLRPTPPPQYFKDFLPQHEAIVEG